MSNTLPSNAQQRLCQNHGYRFDGDFVHLNADVIFSETDIAQNEMWSLQLWASKTGFSGAALSGVKVAELALQAAAGVLPASGICAAFAPATNEPQVLGLALVAYGVDGMPQLRDLAVYPATETFQQPCFIGQVSCEIAYDQATIYAEAIANPRAPSIVSGTLALEVWALDTPYAGGSWQGIPVASVILGVMAGGSEWQAYQVQVPASMPVAGASLTVMLREWTSAGYITRDYRNIYSTPTTIAYTEASPDAIPEVVTEVVTEVAKEVLEDKSGDCIGNITAPDPVIADVATPTAKAVSVTDRKQTTTTSKHLPAKKKSAKAANKPGASKRR